MRRRLRRMRICKGHLHECGLRAEMLLFIRPSAAMPVTAVPVTTVSKVFGKANTNASATHTQSASSIDRGSTYIRPVPQYLSLPSPRGLAPHGASMPYGKRMKAVERDPQSQCNSKANRKSATTTLISCRCPLPRTCTQQTQHTVKAGSNKCQARREDVLGFKGLVPCAIAEAMHLQETDPDALEVMTRDLGENE